MLYSKFYDIYIYIYIYVYIYIYDIYIYFKFISFWKVCEKFVVSINKIWSHGWKFVCSCIFFVWYIKGLNYETVDSRHCQNTERFCCFDRLSNYNQPKSVLSIFCKYLAKCTVIYLKQFYCSCLEIILHIIYGSWIII